MKQVFNKFEEEVFSLKNFELGGPGGTLKDEQLLKFKWKGQSYAISQKRTFQNNNFDERHFALK